MAAPLLIPFIALGSATVALVAASSKKKPGPPNGSATRPGTAKTYMLDANLPPALSAQVIAALSTSTDPFMLDSFAAAIGGSYPYAAAALRYKAATERAHQGVPAPLVAPPVPPASPGAPPQPPPSAGPMPAPPTPPTPAAPVADWQTQILLVPEPTRTQVIQAMMGQNDPNALEAFAKQLEATYPTAAWALRVREAALRGTPIPQAPLPPGLPPVTPAPAPQAKVDPPIPVVVAPPTPPQPSAPAVVPPTPAAPSPAPVVVPAPALPSLGGLDANMPIEMQKAVAGALTTETDPAKLEGFASAIQAQYPVAAGLLSAKAQALRFAQMPHSIPVPPSPPPAPVKPAPAPSPSAGRASFPPSGTYVVASGDSPWSITAKFTGGHGERWHELIAANPDKPTRDDGAWKSLMPGEVVKLPPAWNTNNNVTSTALPAVKSPALLGAANAHA